MNNTQQMPPFMMPGGQQQEDPRIEEQRKTQGERMQLAEERSKDINLFNLGDDAMRYHRENIQHLLTEGKYERTLPVITSSNISGSVPWAPTIGVHITSQLKHFISALNNVSAVDATMQLSKHTINGYLEDIEEQLDHKLTNIMLAGIDDIPRRAFSLLPRVMVEYNPIFVQFCIAVVIRDTKGNILLLKTPDNETARVRNKYTFVQGHIEIENDVNDMSAMDYIIREVKREVNEEVVGIDAEAAKLSYQGLFHDTSEKVSTEHFTAIFSLEVDSLEGIQTNEAEKHNCVVGPIEELRNSDMLDNIVKAILQ